MADMEASDNGYKACGAPATNLVRIAGSGSLTRANLISDEYVRHSPRKVILSPLEPVKHKIKAT